MSFFPCYPLNKPAERSQTRSRFTSEVTKHSYEVPSNSSQTVATITFYFNPEDFNEGPFGELIRSSGTPPCNFGFSTKYRDSETGLNYYGYRYYSANLGRWLGRDPIGIRGGLSLYAIVKNSPINDVDSDGLRTAPKNNFRAQKEINNADQALEHYKSRAGGRVPAGSGLMSDIKNSSGYKTAKKEAEDARKKEMKEQVDPCEDKGKINVPGKTIGFYTGNNAVGHINAKVETYNFEWQAQPWSGGKRTVKGKGKRNLSFDDDYKFEFDPGSPITTFFTDVIPGMIAGYGTPYVIYGKWDDEVNAEITQPD